MARRKSWNKQYTRYVLQTFKDLPFDDKARERVQAKMGDNVAKILALGDILRRHNYHPLPTELVAFPINFAPRSSQKHPQEPPQDVKEALISFHAARRNSFYLI